MRRETQNILLVLLGGALLKIALDGTYLRYVKPYQHVLLILSGATMVLLAVVAIARDIATARHAPTTVGTHCAAGGADDGHGHRSRSTWMLVLPVLAVFLIAPPALGSDAVNRSGGRTNTTGGGVTVVKVNFPPLPAGDVLPMRITDVVTRASWDATNAIYGRTVDITGFVVHRGADIYVARLAIKCCAADAVPMQVKLDGGRPAALRNDQWIEVTGTVQPGSATTANSYIPTLAVSTLRPASAPADPYE